MNEELKQQERKRSELYGLLGDLPSRSGTISAKKIHEQEQDGYILESLILDLNGIEQVPAFFVKPLNSNGPLPAILYNHSHDGNYYLGKNELITGASYIHKPVYAKELAQADYAVLCIDHWAFGQRSGKTESALFKQMLWQGQIMWGMMVYDSLRAVDYLISRPDIDKDRIGTIGISMGSTMAWWLAAIDERIKVCVDICCLTDFHELINTGGLDRHSIYYYVPGLLKHFTTAQINSLIAPRPHLSLAGIYDLLTPLKGLEKIDAELSNTYKQFGNADAWKMLKYDVGHIETPQMRAEIMAFFKKWL